MANEHSNKNTTNQQDSTRNPKKLQERNYKREVSCWWPTNKQKKYTNKQKKYNKQTEKNRKNNRNRNRRKKHVRKGRFSEKG